MMAWFVFSIVSSLAHKKPIPDHMEFNNLKYAWVGGLGLTTSMLYASKRHIAAAAWVGGMPLLGTGLLLTAVSADAIFQYAGIVQYAPWRYTSPSVHATGFGLSDTILFGGLGLGLCAAGHHLPTQFPRVMAGCGVASISAFTLLLIAGRAAQAYGTLQPDSSTRIGPIKAFTNPEGIDRFRVW